MNGIIGGCRAYQRQEDDGGPCEGAWERATPELRGIPSEDPGGTANGGITIR